jgi:uncharacterized protein (TIGR02246 family)
MRSSKSHVWSSFCLSSFTACIVLAGCASPGAGPRDYRTPTTEGCKDTSEMEIASLFERWNASLRTGDPQQVVANYAQRSILLPTVSNKPRLTQEEKLDYFQHFLEKRPSGTVDMRFVDIGCNTAVDAGLYTFTFGATGEVVQARYSYTYRWYPEADGGKWLITSHHSSAMPETAPH